MEISQQLQEAINDQINFEIYSAYIYLSMGAWFEQHNLPGMAHWMEIQFDEEYAHAMRFYRHINERGGKVILKAIAAPQTEWSSALDVFETAYEHEKIVTGRIYKIGEIADSEGDRAAKGMLEWFYDEQVEEEAKTSELRDTLKMIGDNVHALLMLDRELVIQSQFRVTDLSWENSLFSPVLKKALAVGYLLE
ncbi:MAG: ferritin [Candidatus Thorarchaeota archaeon]|jgi:ferritin